MIAVVSAGEVDVVSSLKLFHLDGVTFVFLLPGSSQGSVLYYCLSCEARVTPIVSAATVAELLGQSHCHCSYHSHESAATLSTELALLCCYDHRPPPKCSSVCVCFFDRPSQLSGELIKFDQAVRIGGRSCHPSHFGTYCEVRFDLVSWGFLDSESFRGEHLGCCFYLVQRWSRGRSALYSSYWGINWCIHAAVIARMTASSRDSPAEVV